MTSGHAQTGAANDFAIEFSGRRYRIVELSQEIVPGELGCDGRYVHGEPLGGRPVEIREFVALGARMHFVDGQTHCGTHVESPNKYSSGGVDIGGMPLDRFMGEAVVCDLSACEPGAPITPDDLADADIQEDDIVLMVSDRVSADPPFLTAATGDWLIDRPIKALALENVGYAPTKDSPTAAQQLESALLHAGIPLVDNLTGLEQLTRHRVFFMALPVRVRRLTATWTRAVALEELEVATDSQTR